MRGNTHEDHCSSSVSTNQLNESTSSSCLRLDIISFLNLIGSMDFINQIIVNRTPTKHRIQSKPLVFAYFSLSILTERTKSVKTATQEFTIKTSFFPNFVFQVSLGKC